MLVSVTVGVTTVVLTVVVEFAVSKTDPNPFKLVLSVNCESDLSGFKTSVSFALVVAAVFSSTGAPRDPASSVSVVVAGRGGVAGASAGEGAGEGEGAGTRAGRDGGGDTSNESIEERQESVTQRPGRIYLEAGVFAIVVVVVGDNGSGLSVSDESKFGNEGAEFMLNIDIGRRRLIGVVSDLTTPTLGGSAESPKTT